MKALIGILIGAAFLLGHNAVQATPPAQIPAPTIETRSVQSVRLSHAPNGLAGFSILLESPSTSTAITLSSSFPLSDVRDGIVVSGVDLNDEVQPGAQDIVLFEYEGVPFKVHVIAMDDDAGDPIVLGGQ